MSGNGNGAGWTRRRAVQMALVAAFLPTLLGASPAERADAAWLAHRRAVEEGRPLLLLVVGSGQQFLRGQAFGSVLNHGGDDLHAALALVEVACADPETVERLVGEPVPEGAHYALVETDGVPARVRWGTAAETRSAEVGFEPWSDGWQERVAVEVDEQIRAHRAALLALVLPDRAALRRYAAQASASEPVAAEVIRDLGGDAPADEVARAPAVLASMAADGDVEAVAAMTLLAEVGRAKFVDQVVPGSRWAQAGGCGTVVEGEERDGVAIGCGMGFVTEKARRMLWFYERGH